MLPWKTWPMAPWLRRSWGRLDQLCRTQNICRSEKVSTGKQCERIHLVSWMDVPAEGCSCQQMQRWKILRSIFHIHTVQEKTHAVKQTYCGVTVLTSQSCKRGETFLLCLDHNISTKIKRGPPRVLQWCKQTRVALRIFFCRPKN